MRSFLKTDIVKWIVSFSIFNSILFILFSFRYSAYIETSSSILSWFYLVMTTIGHLGVIPFLGIVLCLLFSFFIRKFKFILAMSVIFNSIGLIFLTVDSFIFSQYRFHLNKFVFDMLLGGGAGDIFQFSGFMYFITIGSILLLLGFQLFVGNWVWRKKLYLRIRTKPIIIILFSMMIGSHLTHAYASALSFSPVTKNAHIYPLYFPLTANSLIRKLGLIDPDVLAKNKVMKSNHSSANMKYPSHELKFKEATKYNVLFVVIDCWRGDCIDSEITPNIFKYAQNGLNFKDHHSGSCGTRGGIFSLFYGLPSFAYWNTMKANYQRPVFMKTLADQNYNFGIFSSSTVTNPAFHQTVFADIEDLRTRTISENSAPYARDAKLTEEWLDFVDGSYSKEKTEPFFGFLFYDSAHGYSHPDVKNAPFQPSWNDPKYLSLDNETDPKPFFNLYKNSLNYVDSLVGKVMVDLDKRNILENTIVVFTGDHGQEFNDNKQNYWGHGSNFSYAQTHVPLAICWPGKVAQTYTHKSLHYDVATTILTDNQGCLSPAEDYSIGRSLWDTSSLDWFVAGAAQNYAIVEKDQITTTLYGSYSVTTTDMKTLGSESLHSNIVFQAMKKSYKFYTN